MFLIIKINNFRGELPDISAKKEPLYRISRLVMGSRSGDIDPGLLPFLAGLGMSVSDIDHMLNKKSGLLGLSGSLDLRPILQGAAQGDVRHINALQVRCRR